MSKYTVDALSLSYIGDLLRDRLGDQASQYLFPDDFEKAVVDIDFKAIVYDGSSAPYDVTVIGKVSIPSALTSGFNSDGNAYATASYIGIDDAAYSVPQKMFMREKSLTEVNLPTNTTVIEADAFNQCSALTTVTGLTNVTNIGQSSFQQTTTIVEINLPNCTTLATSCFNATGAKRIYLPKVQSPWVQNFCANATALEYLQTGSIGYPVTSTSVGNNVFTNVTQTSLTVECYAESGTLGTLLTNLRSRLTGATIKMMAASDMTYNGVDYQAGDVVVTSTP